MKNKHIDNMTMSLYLRGGVYLKKDLVKWAQLHLTECELCAKKLEEQLNKMAEQQQLPKPEQLNLESNVLNKIIALLSLPLKSPSCWDKLKELCSQLADILSESEFSHLQSADTQRLSLLIKTPSPNGKNAKDGFSKGHKIGEKMLSLLEILGDDRIPISKRDALAEELLLYARQKSKLRSKKALED
jgi:hypothetical protein